MGLMPQEGLTRDMSAPFMIYKSPTAVMKLCSAARLDIAKNIVASGPRVNRFALLEMLNRAS